MNDPVWGLPNGLEEYPWWRSMDGIVHGLAYHAPWEQINDHRALGCTTPLWRGTSAVERLGLFLQREKL